MGIKVSGNDEVDQPVTMMTDRWLKSAEECIEIGYRAVWTAVTTVVQRAFNPRQSEFHTGSVVDDIWEGTACDKD